VKIKLAFASGTPALNRAMLDHFEARHPRLPLYVVAEFEPHRGQWIPWHVLRSLGENRAAIQAVVEAHEIAASSVVFAHGTALAKMRVAAIAIAPQHLALYNFPAYLAGIFRPLARWARHLKHPADLEIPLRARTAHAYGVVASRLRGVARETPLSARQPLLDGVSIVVPSRDGLELLRTMLPPLLPQLTSSQRTSGEVIVVDNGSTDRTSEWLREFHPEIRVIQSEAPLSFARAVNAGIVKAQHRRTLLLNNDMVVEPGFIASLEDAFAKVPDLYCATAQIFFPPGVRREETGKAVWRKESPLDFPVRCDEPLPGEDLTWVLYGSGGCSLFDTGKLREMGGVSEVYDPAYVEDMDLGYRAWKRGWPSVFCAGAKVEHRHRATTARFYTARQLDFFVERNYLRFLIHAVGPAELFRRLWKEAIRRLQLLGALDTLRDIPRIAARPPAAVGPLTETEILALGSGDIAAFPGVDRTNGRRPQERKRILIASPYLPFPLSHGGAVRIFNLMKQAAQTYDLILLAFCESLQTPPAELLEICAEVVMVRRHGSHYRRDTKRPDVVEEFESDAFRACLKQTAARWKPVAIQLEFTWMAQYAGACPGARSILVEHDITFDLQQQLLETNSDTGNARWELERQLEKWRRFETAAWREVDCVVAMSAKDAAAIHGAKQVAVIPNGVDCERFQPDDTAPEHKRLLFIGSFAHLPNLLALEFFLREIWPLLGPGYSLHVIAGARPEYYLEFYRGRISVDLSLPGIEVEGFVPDVRIAYRRAEIVLAPLTASAGTNIKVLEAMAMGKAVVGTPAGVSGLDLKSGHDVAIANSAAAFVEAVGRLSENPAQRAAIERNARMTAVARFDWQAIGKGAAAIYGR
jgi:GT2 family glycosyltransferase/glycosyltransferase involved in cell wall biosynthesis